MEKLKQESEKQYIQHLATIKAKMEMFKVTQQQLSLGMQINQNQLSMYLNAKTTMGTNTYIYLNKCLDSIIEKLIAEKEAKHNEQLNQKNHA